MKLRVLFFGILRDRFGTEEHLQEFPGASVRDLLQYYRGVAPELATLWDKIAIAVNQQYVAGSDPLSDGDEVALLPPVSGGSPQLS
jgi:molybdopterin converting factor subunit 1